LAPDLLCLFGETGRTSWAEGLNFLVPYCEGRAGEGRAAALPCTACLEPICRKSRQDLKIILVIEKILRFGG